MKQGEKIEGRTISPGEAEGEVLTSKEPIGFYGNVDLETGEFIEKGHELEGRNISGKVLIFPKGKGSTVGSYVLYGLKKNNKAPAAIINEETETIVATGVILGEIPCIDRLEQSLDVFQDGDKVLVNSKEGYVKILEKEK